MVGAEVTPKQQRPYWERPDEFRYWKRVLAPLGDGTEVLNYASPQARRLWYYLRSMGYVKHPPGWVMEHHGRDGFLLHVVQRGQVWHEIKQRRWRVQQSQACLMDLGQDVRYGVEGARRGEFYWVLINGKDLPAVFLELGADQDPVFPLSDPRRVGSLLQELRQLNLREPTAYEVRSSGILTLVLAELFASRADRLDLFTLAEEARPLSPPVRKAVDYMSRHYDYNVTVKHIAAELVKLSLSHFSRLFHREMGMSAVAYLNRFRVEQAKKLLATGNQSVAEIARSVGFHNQSYFTRMFARIVGVTPLAYRKKPKPRRSN